MKRRQYIAAGLAPQSQSNHPERRAVKRRHGFCDRWRHGLRDRWRRCTALAFRSGRIRGASPTANNCRRYRGSTTTQSPDKKTWAYRLSVSPGWNYESLANTAEIIHRFDTSRVEAACPGQPAGMLGRLTPLASTE